MEKGGRTVKKTKRMNSNRARKYIKKKKNNKESPQTQANNVEYGHRKIENKEGRITRKKEKMKVPWYQNGREAKAVPTTNK